MSHCESDSTIDAGICSDRREKVSPEDKSEAAN